jgi:hypothetical protein
VIQAGVFADQFNAQSRVRALEAQGIQARVTTTANGDTIDSERFSAIAQRWIATLSDLLPISSSFLGKQGTYRTLPIGWFSWASDAVRLAKETAQEERTLLLGPFDERQEADRWSSYFQSIGMDARVYYRR